MWRNQVSYGYQIPWQNCSTVELLKTKQLIPEISTKDLQRKQNRIMDRNGEHVKKRSMEMKNKNSDVTKTKTTV